MYALFSFIFKKVPLLFVLKINNQGKEEEYVTYTNYKVESGNIIHVNFTNGYVRKYLFVLRVIRMILLIFLLFVRLTIMPINMTGNLEIMLTHSSPYIFLVCVKGISFFFLKFYLILTFLSKLAYICKRRKEKIFK